MIVPCPLCAEDSCSYFRIGDVNRNTTTETFDYRRCPSCGLIFQFPVPRDMGNYYREDYYPVPATLGDLAAAAEGERFKMEFLNRYVSGGRLLEIGPANGNFAFLAKQAGFDVETIEMDERCCRFIRETIGVAAHRSDDPCAAVKDLGFFDVIAMWHVIEHLANPWDTLEAVSNRIRAGGILIIASPNPDSFQFGVLRRYWPHVDAPRHLSLIPMPLLAQQAGRLGLQEIRRTTSDRGTLRNNTFGWVEFFAKRSRSRPLSLILQAVGRVVAAVLAPLDRRNGKGSSYTIVFRKMESI